MIMCSPRRVGLVGASGVDESVEPVGGAPQVDPEVELGDLVAEVGLGPVISSPERGVVRITLHADESDIVVRVSDSGAGIAPQFLPHVFDQFRQQDDSVSRRHSGLGLGLALVKHIVLAHGGTVRAESEGLGQGATFTLSLPAGQVRALGGDSDRPSPLPAAPIERLPTGRLAGLHILVVEDDSDARELLVVLLEQQGARVDAAGSCAEALAALERTTPHLMLSDIGLPNADGYELIRAVRQREQGGTVKLPAIALTAYARREDRRLAFEAGFQAHVAKPVEPVELIGVVAELAKGQRLL